MACTTDLRTPVSVAFEDVDDNSAEGPQFTFTLFFFFLISLLMSAFVLIDCVFLFSHMLLFNLSLLFTLQQSQTPLPPLLFYFYLPFLGSPYITAEIPHLLSFSSLLFAYTRQGKLAFPS